MKLLRLTRTLPLLQCDEGTHSAAYAPAAGVACEFYFCLEYRRARRRHEHAAPSGTVEGYAGNGAATGGRYRPARGTPARGRRMFTRSPLPTIRRRRVLESLLAPSAASPNCESPRSREQSSCPCASGDIPPLVGLSRSPCARSARSR